MKILVINGPNLNLLGTREPDIYGSLTYNGLCSDLVEFGKTLDVEISTFQSNIEGELINAIHKAYFDKLDGIIINPGAYTHYSIAIMDALKSITVPTVEVHISNIHQREEFRHISYPAKACVGQICGLGTDGYKMAIRFLSKKI
jgi:3-dehydroquinate dehydratase-2